MAFGDILGVGTNPGTSGSSPTVTLTTTGAGKIVVIATINSASVNSISGGGLTWSRIGRSDTGAFTNKIEAWRADAASALTGAVITLNLNAGAEYATIIAFCIEGCVTGTSDTEGLSEGATAPRSVTTTSANTIVVGGFRFGGTSDPSAGSGFTERGSTGGYTLAETKLLTAAATTSVTTSNDADSNGGVAWAFIKAGGGHVIAVGVASETDTAQAITRRKLKAIGAASEIDSAQAIAGKKLKSVTQASEVDAAQAIARKKLIVVIQASETDTAIGIDRPGAKVVSVTVAFEIDSAQTVLAKKVKAIGAASETDAAQTISRAKLKAIAQALEVDSSLIINWAPKKRAVGAAVETDSALTVSVIQGGVLIANAPPQVLRMGRITGRNW